MREWGVTSDRRERGVDAAGIAMGIVSMDANRTHGKGRTWPGQSSEERRGLHVRLDEGASLSAILKQEQMIYLGWDGGSKYIPRWLSNDWIGSRGLNGQRAPSVVINLRGSGVLETSEHQKACKSKARLTKHLLLTLPFCMANLRLSFVGRFVVASRWNCGPGETDDSRPQMQMEELEREERREGGGGGRCLESNERFKLRLIPRSKWPYIESLCATNNALLSINFERPRMETLLRELLSHLDQENVNAKDPTGSGSSHRPSAPTQPPRSSSPRTPAHELEIPQMTGISAKVLHALSAEHITHLDAPSAAHLTPTFLGCAARPPPECSYGVSASRLRGAGSRGCAPTDGDRRSMFPRLHPALHGRAHCLEYCGGTRFWQKHGTTLERLHVVEDTGTAVMAQKREVLAGVVGPFRVMTRCMSTSRKIAGPSLLEWSQFGVSAAWPTKINRRRKQIARQLEEEAPIVSGGADRITDKITFLPARISTSPLRGSHNGPPDQHSLSLGYYKDSPALSFVWDLSLSLQATHPRLGRHHSRPYIRHPTIRPAFNRADLMHLRASEGLSSHYHDPMRPSIRSFASVHVSGFIHPAVLLEYSVHIVSTTCDSNASTITIAFTHRDAWTLAIDDWKTHPNLFLVAFADSCGRGRESGERSMEIEFQMTETPLHAAIHLDRGVEMVVDTFDVHDPRPSIITSRICRRDADTGMHGDGGRDARSTADGTDGTDGRGQPARPAIGQRPGETDVNSRWRLGPDLVNNWSLKREDGYQSLEDDNFDAEEDLHFYNGPTSPGITLTALAPPTDVSGKEPNAKSAGICSPCSWTVFYCRIVDRLASLAWRSSARDALCDERDGFRAERIILRRKKHVSYQARDALISERPSLLGAMMSRELVAVLADSKAVSDERNAPCSLGAWCATRRAAFPSRRAVHVARRAGYAAAYAAATWERKAKAEHSRIKAAIMRQLPAPSRSLTRAVSSTKGTP
ncbi:hypothetical protein DFH09DRAFT_1094483 [Mycena vulgaris]|nr:hypothetical protein DFH09DRAFT_1094483 [Mycena vulgaris]